LRVRCTSNRRHQAGIAKERGTNESTNGLLREYFPKSTDITDDQTYLDLVARELNNRPRRILGYRTPAEVFTDLLASSIASTG
jgi:IS30 family transposase